MAGNRRRLVATVGISLVALLGVATTAVAVGPLGQEDRSGDLYAEINSDKPRNVILLVGDGTDEAIITAARNYELGADGRFAMDNLPFVGDVTTHGLKLGEGPDYPIAYVSDSAPTATGWSTGRKTVDTRVGQGPSSALNIPGEDYESAMEILADEGKLVGNVSTAALTDATPAAAASHINSRYCQGPRDSDMVNVCSAARKVNGGKGSISEQLVDNQIDVLLGGGYNRFNQLTDAGLAGGASEGQTVIDYAEDVRDYRVVQDSAGLASVTSLDGGPVLGLFAGQSGSENMKPMYEPLVASAPPGAGATDYRCTPADRGNQPTLEGMTQKAIDLLDNPNGFFLQVESAMVDKQEHGSDICGAIGDVKALDRAVQVALDYQAENPDTLIMVTSDHSHSTQIVPNANAGRQTATLGTADGDPMHVAYSTQASGSSHTGSTVRVAAKGPQAANVTGTIDQTDLFQTIVGREPDELPERVVEVEKVVEKVVEKPVEVPGPERLITPAPSAGIATVGRVTLQSARRSGIPIAAVATSADSVRIKVTQAGKTLVNRRLDSSGGRITVKKGVKKGTVSVNVYATGGGGSGSAKGQIKITG